MSRKKPTTQEREAELLKQARRAAAKARFDAKKAEQGQAKREQERQEKQALKAEQDRVKKEKHDEEKQEKIAKKAADKRAKEGQKEGKKDGEQAGVRGSKLTRKEEINTQMDEQYEISQQDPDPRVKELGEEFWGPNGSLRPKNVDADLDAQSSDSPASDPLATKDFEQPCEPTAEQKYDHGPETHVADVPKMTLKRPVQPKEHTIIPDGELQQSEYVSHLVFECDPCPEELRYSDFNENDRFELLEVEVGQKKISVTGKQKRRRHLYKGTNWGERDGTERMSAAKKYAQWREQTIRASDSKFRKAKRLVILIEHEPCGPKGEAGRWAGNIRYLKHMLKTLVPGSHITIVVDVTGNAFTAVGYYQEWLQAMLDLLKDYPRNVVIDVQNGSILKANFSDYHPALQRAEKAHTDDILGHAFDPSDERTEEEKEEVLNLKFAKTREEQVRQIDENLAFCQTFVKIIDFHRKWGTFPALGKDLEVNTNLCSHE